MSGRMEKVIVTLESDERGEVERVHAALRAAGICDSKLISAQIIAGEVAAERRGALERVPGVAAVEGDEEMRAV